MIIIIIELTWANDQFKMAQLVWVGKIDCTGF